MPSEVELSEECFFFFHENHSSASQEILTLHFIPSYLFHTPATILRPPLWIEILSLCFSLACWSAASWRFAHLPVIQRGTGKPHPTRKQSSLFDRTMSHKVLQATILPRLTSIITGSGMSSIPIPTSKIPFTRPGNPARISHSRSSARASNGLGTWMTRMDLRTYLLMASFTNAWMRGATGQDRSP